MIKAIIIGHGDFARAMLNTATQIVGEQSHVDIISNAGLSQESIIEKINRCLSHNQKSETIIFVDLPGGSCTISCYNLLKINKKLNIVCGINLPILLEFFMLRDKYPARELVPILIKKGRETIFQLKDKI
jgi:mannose/fructose/sorbose-specific phosphotransferase system IIA component